MDKEAECEIDELRCHWNTVHMRDSWGVKCDDGGGCHCEKFVGVPMKLTLIYSSGVQEPQ